MKLTKLFKLEKEIIPEWGKSYDHSEEFILADKGCIRGTISPRSVSAFGCV
jgi:hypothetical protein